MNLDSVLRAHGVGESKYRKNVLITDADLEGPVITGGTIAPNPKNTETNWSTIALSPDGFIYAIKDSANPNIFKYDEDLNFITSFVDDRSNQPINRAIFDKDGFLYILKSQSFVKINVSSKSVVYSLGNPTTTQAARDAVVDKDGNLIIVFDGNLATYNVQKYTPAGGMIWRYYSGFTQGNCIAVDLSGNIYVGAGGNNSNTSSVVLTKLAPDGTKLWEKTYGDYSGVYGITYTMDGRLYIASLNYNAYYVLYEVDPATGSRIASVTPFPNVNYSGYTQSSFIADKDGSLFLGTIENKVQKFDKKLGKKWESVLLAHGGSTGGQNRGLVTKGEFVYAISYSTANVDRLVKVHRSNKFKLL